jgi:SAM-dependent methyltransferase
LKRTRQKDLLQAHKGDVDLSRYEIFEREAARYDAWFDSEDGKMLFASELLGLRQLSDDLPRPWLEVGVGTGRFADGLGIDFGIDPAFRILQYAKRRGIRTVRALGQMLPFKDEKFGAVFVIGTLCFADDPAGLLREAVRVTRPEGGIVVAIVPAESPWGRFYASRGKAGHVFYSAARFYTLKELRDLARVAGLQIDRVVSTLFGSPDDGSFEIERPYQGEDERGGFVAMLLRPRSRPAGNTTTPAQKEQDAEAPRSLFCMKENTEIDPDHPYCPYPSSQCRFREWCPVREAMRSKRRKTRE